MAALSGPRIRHSVAFALHHTEGSAEEATFLDAFAEYAPVRRALSGVSREHGTEGSTCP